MRYEAASSDTYFLISTSYVQAHIYIHRARTKNLYNTIHCLLSTSVQNRDREVAPRHSSIVVNAWMTDT